MLFHDFLTNQNRKIHKTVHFFPIYEKHLQKYVNQSVTVFEIGSGGGGSAQMLKRYLGPFATIVSLDINPNCKNYEEHQIYNRTGDQSDIEFLQSLIDEFGTPDIVIDDGSHIMKHITASFNFLYDLASKNGTYIVEDLQVCYWDNYGGGLKHPDSFLEKVKDLIDLLHARHNGLQRDFAEQTFSMCIYDSVVVLEKKKWPKNGWLALIIGDEIKEPIVTITTPDYTPPQSKQEIRNEQLNNAFKNSRWIKFGKKLGFLKGI